jgi:hypothetical protein
VQVDFDPTLVTYDDLLAVFWSSHAPREAPRSRQYASMIFAHSERQQRTAGESKEMLERVLGPVSTRVVPLARFYLAEDYHQKYRLRGTPDLARAFKAMYPDEADLRESTAAARVNGYLYGYGDARELESEIAAFGLTPEEAGLLRRLSAR